MNEKTFHYSYLGVMDYLSALELQRRTVQSRLAGEISETVFFLQHPPVYTLGKKGNTSCLLISREELAKKGLPVIHTGRGGDVAFHGPGQLIIYPIIKLDSHYRGVRSFISLLEKTAIHTLQSFGIAAQSDPQYPGVWVGRDKIAALGVRIQRGVSMHGLCLNVQPEPDYFQWIIPCGIRDRGMTSIHECNGRAPDIEIIMEEFVRHFARLFALSAVRQ
ncbi:MAG: lipoyl(octanoyl) transferase LipB [Nitrospinae bacterium]|nr:lipoyl(octanoyl) transferase LipB [Nitrospinota bacterium]